MHLGHCVQDEASQMEDLLFCGIHPNGRIYVPHHVAILVSQARSHNAEPHTHCLCDMTASPLY